MWFKNLTLLRCTAPLALTVDSLSAQLAQHPFQACPSFQPRSAGWSPPLGRKTHALVHALASYWLLCLRTEERLLPAVAVNQALAERIASIEDEQRRTVRRRERSELREQLVQELLPRALTRSRLSYAYLDMGAGWLVVDSASPRAVEEFSGALRSSLDSLPVAPLAVRHPVSATMTTWLKNGTAPQHFSFGDSCELREGGDDGGIVRCRGQDLTGDEIAAHLAAAKQVTRLALIWRDRLAFVLDEGLILRRLQFLDVIREALHEDATPSAAALFDAEFALMTGELTQLIPEILEAFGGATEAQSY